MTATDRIKPPSALLLALELRYGLELGAHLLTLPFMKLPHGDGHPVMVIPGFGTTDASSFLLRRALKRLGYAAHGWGQGRNLGMNARAREALRARLPELHREHGRKLSLIGWSLGGVFARELARHQPEHVRRVITLGSPINHAPDATNVDALFRRKNPDFKHDLEAFRRRCTAPGVPCHAIYSRSDGIVAWQTSLENEAPHTENVEVFSSHFGLGVNPLVLRVIAERLARPEV
ncbi:MAG TPA: alpha/beta fold hydrolase [Solimonas sp.]|nr:alpha/beta fold hydrolase [Solimonas sp.]